MKPLEGKLAIIMSAGSGFGKAAAKQFAASGASVVLVPRGHGPPALAVEETQHQGGRALAIVGDVTEQRTHQETVAVAQTKFGGLHIGFNNAGLVGAMRPLAEIEPQQWLEVLAVKLTAAFFGVRAQIPAMLELGGGALVFTGNFVGNSMGLPGMRAYGASKAGLLVLSAA